MAIEKNSFHDKNLIGDGSISNPVPLQGDESFKFDPIDFYPTVNFDNLESPHNIAKELQDTVDEIIQQCPDVDWSEDYLSFQVISAIRYVLGNYRLPGIEYYSDISKFDIEAYKLTGQAEQKHGDIAIIVTRSYKRTGWSMPISGVGFYEAKASSLKGCSYPAFSFQQLRTLVTNTPKLSYLLYDKESRFADSQEWPTSQEDKDRNPIFGGEKFHVRTVDANFIKQYRSMSLAADSISQSFGYHFVQKILSGRELDYSRPPIETIYRWLKVTRRTTALVISIAVREDEDKSISAQLQIPGFEKLMLQNPSGSGFYELPSERPRLSGPKD